MGSFLRGVVFGIGLSWLIAPMRGQEMRHLLRERFQQLRGSLPQTPQLGQVTQQPSNRVSQIADEVQNAAQQVTAQVKHTASVAGEETEQTSPASSAMRQMEQDVAGATKQTTTPAPQAPQSTQANANSPSTIVLLRSIPGVDPETQRKLEAQGIRTTQQLLEHTSTKEGRADLAHKVGLDTQAFKVLVTRADLMRLQGVGGDIATLLEEAGVSGCKDLQQRNPKHLQTKLAEVQESRKIATYTPELEQITLWIAEAKAITGSTAE